MITSATNPLVKEVLQLHEKKGRLKTCSFLIEGRRELELAIKHKIEIRKIIYCPDIIADIDFYPGEKIEVSKKVLEKISYRGDTEGFAAVAKIPDRSLLTVPPEPLLVVLDKLEKPGNIGAILRTADVAGADAVLLCDGIGDLYNPNLIRASLGAVFSLPVFCLSSAEALSWLKKRDIKIAAASPYASQTCFEYDWKGARAIVIGSEKDGLSAIWNEQEKIIIPMSGEVDSLNASAAAAVLIYEATRQRG